MKTFVYVLIFFFTLPFSLGAEEPQVDAHMVLYNTEQRVLHCKATNRDYLLYIGYPDSYGSHPERKYPVVYITDAYWSFLKMFSLGSSLWYDQIVPEYIVVGIGYPGKDVDYQRERFYELTPTALTRGEEADNHWRMGGARAFLDAFRDEIIPYVEKNTRADPSFRAIAGTSLGALFGLYAMYEEPGLFQGVIAASPSIDWDNYWLFHLVSQLQKQAEVADGKGVLRVPSRLFLGVGSGESTMDCGSVEAYDRLVASSNYADFDYKFQVFEGERHGGAALPAFETGIRFIFKPMMPSPAH